MASQTKKYRNPYYIYQGKKVSNRSYTLPYELPFSSEPIVNHLVNDDKKFVDLVEVISHVGLNLSRYDKAK